MTIQFLSRFRPKLYNDTQSEDLSDSLANYKVTLRENSVGVATIGIDNDESQYPDDVVSGDALTLSIGETLSSVTPIFTGKVQFPTAVYNNKQNRVMLNCVHAGYGLCEMLVAEEYGSQSTNSGLDTLTEILTETNHGILPCYVDKVFEGAASGWDLYHATYTADHVATINNVISYIELPYKPADKAINDLVDLVTALRSTDAGPHWIVDNNGFFRLKLLGTSQSASAGSGAPDWTLWYQGTANTAGQATITLGDDADLVDYEELGAEGNYIIGYGNLRIPDSGDSWTEADVSGWGKSSAHLLVSSDNTTYCVGNACLHATFDALVSPAELYYPSTKDLALDFSSFQDIYHIPSLKFTCMYKGISNLKLYLCTDAANYIEKTLTLNAAEQWQTFVFPLGEKFRSASMEPTVNWTGETGTIDWTDINWIQWNFGGSSAATWFKIDGLYMGDAPVCRVAYDSTLASGTTKMRFLPEFTNASDSLLASDDSGTFAQLVKAEYLRQKQTTYNPVIKLPLLPDCLPGMQFSFNSTTYRATQIVHEGNGEEATTTLTLTSDVTNGLARKRYEDNNRIYTNFRPTTQDRAATSLSRSGVDYRVARLVKDYGV